MPKSKPGRSASSGARRLLVVLGDQLNHGSPLFDDIDRSRDVVWMAEAQEEADYVWSHQLRLVAFFSAMRHFCLQLEKKGFAVRYHRLSEKAGQDRHPTLAGLLQETLVDIKPCEVRMVKPGDYRVEQSLLKTVQKHKVPCTILEDRHFYCTLDQFNQWADGQKSLVLENFYRTLRRQERILVTEDGKPVGGKWNLDHDNRDSFGKTGPEQPPAPITFKPDAITREVIGLVKQRFGTHPGSADHFNLPVTAKEAQRYLDDFIRNRLADFGRYEDAMWTDAPVLYHSRLSMPLNLKLLDPRDCVQAAVDALEAGDAPLNSVEGFVRQILGWREFVRGIYWRHMPDYAEMNSLDHQHPVPAALWDGQTEMTCVRQAMKGVLELGYAHHIQRLMVLGLYCQLLGVHPGRFHDWHMAMYIDAVDWVSLPNALGMSQWGDNGIMATKPYCASGRYISRMSNYCKNCRYDPVMAVGQNACPMTTLYWDFLDRNQKRFAGNQRMVYQIRNLERKSKSELDAIRKAAQAARQEAFSREIAVP